jgi:quercetin 2,3-dioxygenase
VDDGGGGRGLEMVQLWVNLPAADKKSPPKYQGILAGQIPVVPLPDGAGTVRVIAGEFQDSQGPAHTFTPIQLWDLRLAAGRAVRLPVADGDTTLLVVQRGSVTLNGTETARGVELVEFDRAGSEIAIEAQEDATALVLSGRPIGEPVYGQGPFVMNTREEIQQAIVDFQSGRMGRLR